MIKFVVLTLFLALMTSASCQELTSIQSKLDQVYYLYPNQVREEKQLPECEAWEVCSTEHNRYWLPTWVRRYCRCPTSDCSERAASLDTRSHIKVCTSEKDRLDACSNKEVGLEATKMIGKRTVVNIFCRCPWPAYWALAGHIENTTLIHDKYACQYKMKKCQAQEFCGHIRSDTYSMYLQCVCPHNYICLNKDRNEYNVSEALYYGPAMRAYCLPIQDHE